MLRLFYCDIRVPEWEWLPARLSDIECQKEKTDRFTGGNRKMKLGIVITRPIS